MLRWPRPRTTWQANDIELADLEAATGFEFVNLLDSTVEALLIDEADPKGLGAARQPGPQGVQVADARPQQPIRATKRVSIIRNVANKMASLGEQADISDVMDGVSELLDRSVGTREYIIRAAGEEQALLDLNQIDWEQLAITFAANKRTAAKAVERELEKQIDDAVRKNPTVVHLAERLRQLIADYNAGTLNAEEYLRRLAQLHGSLAEHQRRVVEEELTEAELAIFDLLTKPAPELTDGELRKVREAAQRLLVHIEETLVLDWKKKEESKATLRVTIRRVLDDELPEAYGREIFDVKRQAIYEHIYASFGNDGESVYDGAVVVAPAPVVALPTTEEDVTDADVDQADAERFARMIEELYGDSRDLGAAARTADGRRGERSRRVQDQRTLGHRWPGHEEGTRGDHQDHRRIRQREGWHAADWGERQGWGCRAEARLRDVHPSPGHRQVAQLADRHHHQPPRPRHPPPPACAYPPHRGQRDLSHRHSGPFLTDMVGVGQGRPGPLRASPELDPRSASRRDRVLPRRAIRRRP
ncbi:MAG: type I restriction enzyme endonuclease domain-containing protein [Microthrixaceae bacterium]